MSAMTQNVASRMDHGRSQNRIFPYVVLWFPLYGRNLFLHFFEKKKKHKEKGFLSFFFSKFDMEKVVIVVDTK